MKTRYIIIISFIIINVILTSIVLYDVFRKKVTPKVSWLAAQTAADGTATSTTLTLNTKDKVFMFSDRPNRISKHIDLSMFTSLWDTNSSLNKDPPNAVITWKDDKGKMALAEVILTNAKVNSNGFIEYMYVLETGDTLIPKLTNVSLFIDDLFLSHLLQFLTQKSV